jgi:hypothetical protein
MGNHKNFATKRMPLRLLLFQVRLRYFDTVPVNIKNDPKEQ